MRQFQVPQFIEVEDKIFGPLTLKQFLYVLGGGAALFLLYVFLPLPLVILFGSPIAVFFGALAFYQVNGRPFVSYLQNMFSYFTKSRLYVWRKEEKKIVTQNTQEATAPGNTALNLPKLSQNKLNDLAWSLDVQEKAR